MFRELEKNLKKNPMRKILFFEGKKISCRELEGQISAFACRLKSLGVGAGDVVTIALPNIPQAVIAIYAVNKIGGISNLIHPRVPAKKAIAIMKKCGSRTAIMLDEIYVKEKVIYDSVDTTYIFAKVATFLPQIKKKLYLATHRVRKSDLGGVDFFNGKGGGESATCESYKSGKNSTAVFLHSGGTTGEPKTVVLTNENINYVARNSLELLGDSNTEGKGMLAVLPMFHGFGLCMSMHTPMIHNMQCVLIPKFSPTAVVRAMRKTNVSVVCGVPKMFEKMLCFDGFASKDILRKLQVCFCGGDSVKRELSEKFNGMMKRAGSRCRLFEGYGMTECVAVCTVNTNSANRICSCGKPIRGTRVKIFGKNGREVERGELGEIAVSSPAISARYLDGTSACKEGYLKTGDIGWVDHDGYLYFKQREKHILNISGYNVFPTEIVEVANELEEVENCVVLSCKKASEEFARLVVKKKKGVELSVEMVQKHLENSLEGWSVPKEIVISTEDFPTTMMGKADILKMQEKYGN